MKHTRILVTGGSGFIGSHTVDLLLSMGCEVIAVDDMSTGRASNLFGAAEHPNFTFVEADITELGKMNHLVKVYRPDSIIHLAGLVSVIRAQEEPELNYRLNLHATQMVAEAARFNGVKRVVFASSASVYGDDPSLPVDESILPRPISIYGTAKRASEELLQGYGACFGIEAICLRYFNVFGSRQDPKSPYSGVISIFSELFSQGKQVTVFGDGSQTRDFIAVEDIARANALAATRPGLKAMIANVCTGRPRALRSILNVFQGLYPEAPAPLFTAMREGEILHSCGNPSFAAEMLGFRSQTDLEVGLRALILTNPELVAA